MSEKAGRIIVTESEYQMLWRMAHIIQAHAEEYELPEGDVDAYETFLRRVRESVS